MSKYQSPFAAKKRSTRLRGPIAVLAALVIGIGIGIAATGGIDLPDLNPTKSTSTPYAIAAADETDSPEPTAVDEDDPTATSEVADEPTNTPSNADPIDESEPTDSPPTETPPPEPTDTPEPEPTEEIAAPEEAAQRFADAWTAGDYATLYSLLSADSRAATTEQEFVDRFAAIATEVGITETVVQPKGSADLELTLPVEITYSTGTVGEIKEEKDIQLVREDELWKVQWNPSLIFNQLGDGCVDFVVENVRRGSILDRDGDPLAYDGTASIVGVIPAQFVDEDAEVAELAKLIDVDADDIKAIYADSDPGWFYPVKQYPTEVDDSVKTKLSEIPGAALRSETARIYPLGEQAAHLTGYVTRVNAEDLESDPTGELAGVDWIGRAGIEAGANDLLTGQPGGRLMVVDCTSRAERKEIASRKAEQPQDVILTIDKDFQIIVDEALGDVTGSTVIIDPRTGGLMALVSHPSYDPNWFVTGLTGTNSNYINDESKRPLLNRAAEAAYPTGSIFKVITMSAAMADLGYTGETPIDCPQEFSLPGTDQVWRDWTDELGLGAQGMLTLHTGLVNSCNTVFYQIGAALDEQNEDWLPDMAKAYGLGSATGIPYFPEVAGTIPSPQWKQDVIGDFWARGDAVNMAIGQGYVEVTPLQMANAYTAIANGGTLLQPFVVEFVKNVDGSQERIGKRTVIHDLPLDGDQVAELQSALRDQASNSWGAGSARVFADFPWPIAGKTGTAENAMTVGQKPHAWFAAFGPYGETATIASIVMVESSGEGVTHSAPRTKVIYEAYLQTDLMNEET